MRKSWPEYFMDIALEVATRATCPRKHVGCVLVEHGGKSILATGYNGSVRGGAHCDQEGCDIVESIVAGEVVKNCVRTVHAEANAVAQAAARGVKISGAIAYVTAFPCWPCFKLLANAGVREVVFADAYKPDPRITGFASNQAPSVHWVEDLIVREIKFDVYMQDRGPTQSEAAYMHMARYQRCRDLLPDFQVTWTHWDARDPQNKPASVLWMGGTRAGDPMARGSYGLSQTFFPPHDAAEMLASMGPHLEDVHRAIAKVRWGGGW